MVMGKNNVADCKRRYFTDFLYQFVNPLRNEVGSCKDNLVAGNHKHGITDRFAAGLGNCGIYRIGNFLNLVVGRRHQCRHEQN